MKSQKTNEQAGSSSLCQHGLGEISVLTDEKLTDEDRTPRSGGKWWRGRLVLSTILALTLSTYFVVVASVNLQDRGAMQEQSGDVKVVFPRIPLMAVAICWFADLMIWMFQSETFDRKNPVASVLAGSLIRTMVILGALGFTSATKWPAHNSFGNYLVGCYFSFLVLESWLAIRRSATRNYSPKPL
ncbi:MAG: hypothetical protein MUC43_16355 [Pirellula sp.]|jgi:TRAP-type mannitol/chloroaromatic compound transport system permease large subunit|nr:hypothetical protein [Pirellula sp.]